MTDEPGREASEIARRLEVFLSREAPDHAGTVSDYGPLTGGYSRLMGSFTVTNRDGEQRYVIRGTAPAGRSIFNSDLDLEWQVLQSLLGTAVATPAARWFDRDGDVLGTPAIVIDLHDGQPLTRWSDPSRDEPRSRLAKLAATVHDVDTEVLPSTIVRPSSWDAYVEARIDRLREVEAAHVERDPFLRYLCGWLSRNRPTPMALTLVHGDFQAANVLFGADGELALVDWELARIGDPREDLGRFKLAAAVMPPDLIGEDEAAFCATYRSLRSASVEAVNPSSIAYFSIVGAIDGFGMILPQLAALAAGDHESVLVAYLSNALPFLHQQCMKAVAQVEGDHAVSQPMEVTP